MALLWLVFETLCALIGGLAVALILSLLCWWAAKFVRHPEWGPCLAFLGLIIVLYEQAGSSQLVQMTLLFSGLIAIACWGEGNDWRARQAETPEGQLPAIR